MAEVYRYILQNKARGLVLLEDEMIFLQNYFYLLKIRFEAAIQLIINIPENSRNNFLIPPISLQLLIENAVKHNEFSDAQPLVITLQLQSNLLLVQNDIRRKKVHKQSSKIGLANLQERYKLTTGREVIIEETPLTFIVKLPVLPI